MTYHGWLQRGDIISEYFHVITKSVSTNSKSRVHQCQHHEHILIGFGNPRIFCRNLYVSSQQVEQMSGLVPNVQTKSWSRTSSNDVTEMFKCTMPVTKNSCAEDMIVTFSHKLVLYFLSMGEVSLLALVVALASIEYEVLTCDCGICLLKTENYMYATN